MIGGVLDHLWQSTVVALAAGGLTLLLRRNGAGIRYWVWFAASVKFLVPFALLAAAGAHLRLPRNPIVSAPPAVFVMEQIAQPFSSEVPVVALRETGISWVPVLTTLWALGCGALLVAWLRRWRRIAVALRHAKPLNMPAPLPVMTSDAFLEPGLVGLRRPVLLLPEGIATRLTEGEMTAIVSHELCHLRRRDNLTGAIHMLVQAVFWFHPLVWWVGARLVAERERACDDAVLDTGNDPQTYAESILKVCKFYVQSPLLCAAGVSGSDLRWRVEMIMANRRAAPLSTKKTALLVAAGLALLAVPIAAGLTAGSLVRGRTVMPSEGEVTRNISAQARPRVAVPFDPSKFDKYVGYYQAHAMITVTRDGERFFTQLTLGVNDTRMTPKLKIEVFPESETKFFAKDVVAQYSFETDSLGRVTELVYHQSGLQRRFKRIDEREARQIEAAVAERIRKNMPSPGTEAALRRYIEGLYDGRPNYDELALGIAVRVRWTLPNVEKRIRTFGELKGLSFKGVGPDGMDVYLADFENRQVEWWVAPLTADGKITWSGFTPR